MNELLPLIAGWSIGLFFLIVPLVAAIWNGERKLRSITEAGHEQAKTA